MADMDYSQYSLIPPPPPPPPQQHPVNDPHARIQDRHDIPVTDQPPPSQGPT